MSFASYLEILCNTNLQFVKQVISEFLSSSIQIFFT